MAQVSLKDWLQLIELHGSVRCAAKTQSLSVEAVSRRFRRLDDSDPIKQEYKNLVAKTRKKRKPKIYPDSTTGNRIRQQKWQENKKKS